MKLVPDGKVRWRHQMVRIDPPEGATSTEPSVLRRIFNWMKMIIAVFYRKKSSRKLQAGGEINDDAMRNLKVVN